MMASVSYSGEQGGCSMYIRTTIETAKKHLLSILTKSKGESSMKFLRHEERVYDHHYYQDKFLQDMQGYGWKINLLNAGRMKERIIWEF